MHVGRNGPTLFTAGREGGRAERRPGESNKAALALMRVGRLTPASLHLLTLSMASHKEGYCIFHILSYAVRSFQLRTDMPVVCDYSTGLYPFKKFKKKLRNRKVAYILQPIGFAIK
jgi:hypothetical protein